MKRNVPQGLIAEIMFRLKRGPVTRTKGGVYPFGAQVGGAAVKARTDSPLILEEDLGPYALRLGTDLRVFGLQPRLDQGPVLLIGPVQRFLAGEP